MWESEAGQNFSIPRDSAGEDPVRETKIELFVKEVICEFLEEKKLNELMKRHFVEKTEKKEVLDDDEPDKK
jgi:HSP90 family molecular chaperone